MRVVLLTDNLRAGGKERRLVELLKGLSAKENVELHLIIFSEEVHYKAVYELDVKISHLKRVPNDPKVLYRLYTLCKQWQPDLIHSWGTMSTIFAIPTSILLNVPIINGNIANAPANLKFFNPQLRRARFTFPFSKVIVGNSLAGLKAYGAPLRKSVCIYNGFDFNRVKNLKSEARVRAEYNIKTPYLIGMVASFTNKKDFYSFIRTALIVLEKRKDVTFIMVGDGVNRASCEALVPEKHKNQILFTGLQQDVESIVNVFTIGVLSTNAKVHGEGISNAILEYMILSKPVIATIGGGTSEVVEDGKTGILIPPFSPDIMTEKLNYLLENQDVVMKMGLAGKKRLKEVFSLRKMTSSFYDLYIKILDK